MIFVHVYEVRLRKDKRRVDLVSHAPAFGWLYGEPKVSRAVTPTRSDRPKPSQGHGSVCALDFRPGYSTA
jgi:hypothetical protein